jgi:hypothetical protein
LKIEIVDLPIKDGDFPVRFLYVYQAGYPSLAGRGHGEYQSWTSVYLLDLKFFCHDSVDPRIFHHRTAE